MSKGAGWIVLFGSGETSPSGRKAFDWLMQRLTMPVGVAIVETPAGFELNSAQVAGRVGDFLKKHLQNYRPQITVVPARKRGTLYSPDSPEIAAQIIGSDLIFLGPGSPTYAARQLRDSVTWYTVLANQRLGSALVLASAAAIASGALALPVYEIYKVGQDLHWQEGLDLFAAYGLSLVFVPHWNNRDGGVELDTSRCYMGQARFEPLLEMLPPDVTVVGIDEGTALAMHMESGTCHVLGQGGVTVLGGGGRERFEQPATFSIDRLGSFRQPVAGSGLPQVLGVVGPTVSRVVLAAAMTVGIHQEHGAPVLHAGRDRRARAGTPRASACTATCGSCPCSRPPRAGPTSAPTCPARAPRRPACRRPARPARPRSFRSGRRSPSGW